jgi:hypothetical protein
MPDLKVTIFFEEEPVEKRLRSQTSARRIANSQLESRMLRYS